MSDFVMRRLLQRTPGVGGEWSGAGNYENPMRMTHAEWLAYEARQNRRPVKSEGVDDESELHNDIIKHCKSRGWLYFHGSMAHKTYRTKGEPDFIIFADIGRVFAIECKSKSGKLSTDQLGVIAWARQLGHEARFRVVSSYGHFKEVVK